MPAAAPLQAVPCNIITGFLGVGKTSAILQLLKHKPAEERWAVLVNEFGQVGIDGSILQGREQAQLFVKEVPGGCMCCTAGLPMQIALNQLLQKARPQRLLIEPTGLGHPEEILATLSSEFYREVIDLQRVVTLVDARQLAEPRYLEHPVYCQQLAIADVIVGNKSDLYQPSDRQRLSQVVDRLTNKPELVFGQMHGRGAALAPELLAGPSQSALSQPQRHQHGHSHSHENPTEAIPSSGHLSASGSGEGYHSQGWRFSPTKVFDRAALYNFLAGLSAQRFKGVFITEEGVFGYNYAGGALSEIELDDCMESRLEIIDTSIDPGWEQQLLNCLSQA